MHDIGVAVDIGTTTVVVSLLDINTSELVGDDTRQLKYLSSASGVNAQRFYGADVITRINYCAKKGHEKLTDLIREQVAELIKQASEKYSEESGLNRGEIHIRQITITGNTGGKYITGTGGAKYSAVYRICGSNHFPKI